MNRSVRLSKIKKRVLEQQKEIERTDAPEAEESGIDGLVVDPVYCSRGPRDVVLSGPLLGRSVGRGRVFSTPEEALYWAQDKYGMNRVSLVNPSQEAVRWAVIVKNLRA